jgi:hypothetical protein
VARQKLKENLPRTCRDQGFSGIGSHTMRKTFVNSVFIDSVKYLALIQKSFNHGSPP